MAIKTINPATGKVLETYSIMDKKKIDKTIVKTHQAYLAWSSYSIAQRALKLQTVAKILLEKKEHFATLIANEMGKPITAGLAEIEKCAWVCEYYATHAQLMLEPTFIQTNLNKSYILFQPTGIIFAVMPWNFPFWQVFRYAAPTLMAGNACLLKHAAISTGAGLAIEKLFNDAGLPECTFSTLVIETSEVNRVIADPKITGVTLTGSAQAGKAVASAAGRHLKKVILELGGSDPYLVLEDADLKLSAETCVTARLNNSGQVCIAAKRIFVHTKIFDQFKENLMTSVSQHILGDPLKKNTTLGPLAREDLRKTVHHQVQQSINLGAQLITGGKIPKTPGFFYPPTVLTNVRPNTPLFDEEVFGPVICLTRVKTEAQAITLANQTAYGLGAAVFTSDIERGEKIAAEKLIAGACSVNTAVHSDPRLPFGGTKQSGFGRELGEYGLKSFVNIKTIQIK